MRAFLSLLEDKADGCGDGSLGSGGGMVSAFTDMRHLSAAISKCYFSKFATSGEKRSAFSARRENGFMKEVICVQRRPLGYGS